MDSVLKFVFSGIGGLAFLGLVLFLRKLNATARWHKTHATLLCIAGFQLAFITGRLIGGSKDLLALGIDPLVVVMRTWHLWPIFSWLPDLVHLIPPAMPYILGLAFVVGFIAEVWPKKNKDERHTAWLGLFFAGGLAQLPLIGAALGAGG